MNLFVRVGDPTASLFFRCRLRGIKKRKPADLLISELLFHFGVVKTSTIDPWRCARFQSVRFEPPFYQLLGQPSRGLFCHSSATKIFLANMNKAVQKSSIR